jgi:magnesium chelatase subunit D
VLRARPGPVRSRWLEWLGRLLDSPLKRLPAHADEEALLGGLDLSSALRGGTIRFADGLLARSDGGVLLVPMAERLGNGAISHLTRALDQGSLNIEREGFSKRVPARFGVVALDEHEAEEDGVAGALSDRLSFRLDLESLPLAVAERSWSFREADVQQARERLQQRAPLPELEEALVHTAGKLGIRSLRAPLLALRCARAAAALFADGNVEPVHGQIAARLVLAPRAEQLPGQSAEQEEQHESEAPPPPPSERENDEGESQETLTPTLEELTDLLTEAARAVLPADLETLLGARPRLRSIAARGASGRTGPVRISKDRGRAAGTLDAAAGGRRLDLLATLRGAAPWQKLREQHATRPRALYLEPGDLRFRRFKQQAATVTIFCVDASGSAAMQRLAETKGAVELLLADCYVRRDSAALIAFRNRGADVLLAPTRSLARAKRQLAGLAGGGATPLAAGLSAARELADQSYRRGCVPCLVLLTDGRANVALDGRADRQQAYTDAERCARELAALELRALVIDTSPRGQAGAQALARAMAGTYLRLPYANAQSLSAQVRQFAEARV